MDNGVRWQRNFDALKIFEKEFCVPFFKIKPKLSNHFLAKSIFIERTFLTNFQIRHCRFESFCCIYTQIRLDNSVNISYLPYEIALSGLF